MDVNMIRNYGSMMPGSVGTPRGPQGPKGKGSPKSKKIAEDSYTPAKLDKAERKSTPEAGLSEKAKKVLENLRQKFTDTDFFVSGPGRDAQSLLNGSTQEYSVVLSNEELERMADDENYAAKKSEQIQSVMDMTKSFVTDNGFDSQFGKMNDTVLKNLGFTFNDDDTTTFFAEVERTTLPIMRQRLEAASQDDLASKMQSIDWEALFMDRIQHPFNSQA
ncbi:MAG: DUF6033 family protein [Lachnospiraceae bacterium]|nr:DUF6033 family protein [Lachnospiraceae bacterium]